MVIRLLYYYSQSKASLNLSKYQAYILEEVLNKNQSSSQTKHLNIATNIDLDHEFYVNPFYSSAYLLKATN